MNRQKRALWILTALATAAAGLLGCKGPTPTNPGVIAREPNRLLWGDTHLHTRDSGDAPFAADRSAGSNNAYRWAKGLPAVNPVTRARVQLRAPLDFLVVTDPAEGLEEAAWGRAIEAAERHYAPCAFTTFIAWEWTSEVGGHRLHRAVLMNEGAEQARQLVPFSALDGSGPEQLWAWLEETSNRVETDFIAIPRGSNLSGGMMYPEVDSEGKPIAAAYAQARSRWEPLTEVTGVEGDAGARTALLRGLQLGQSAGANPFAFGMIGATGSHTGLDGPDSSARGLTAVWAEENTRTSIFDAFQRKEVYATTGPRMRVRFFGGWNFKAKQAGKASMVTVGYMFGRPMGSELSKRPSDEAPSFLMYAVKDPKGANLDRIQMVKGWVDSDGEAHEKVYDVTWSAGRELGSDGKLPPVKNTVDLETAGYENTEGVPALHGFWSDSHFDPEQPALYYLRVLQVPTPSDALYDAVARGANLEATEQPPTIQERAYTSPIWYTP